MKLNPYLNFNGKTAEAMKFYQSVLGGELKMQTFADAKMSQSDADKDLVMHADLNTEGINLMASDGHPTQDVKYGDNFHLSLTSGPDELDKLTEIFNKLAEGGKVDMALEKAPWGDTFGMLTDKFGVHWMVNVSSGTPFNTN